MPFGDFLKKKRTHLLKDRPPDPPLPGKPRLPLEDVDLDAISAENFEDCFPQKSTLTKSLDDVLSDLSAIGYFIQYLEARDAVALVKFWLDVHSFKAANNVPNHDPDRSRAPLRNPDRSRPSPPQSPSSLASSVDPESELSDRLVSAESLNSGCDPTDAEVVKRKDGADKRTTEDAVRLYQKYIAPDSPLQIPLSTETIHQIVQGICSESGSVEAECFDPAIKCVYETLDREFYRDFLRSEYHAKHQVDILTGGKVEMTDVLVNDTLLFHFMEFMDGEGVDKRLLEFWITAKNFQQQVQQMQQPQMQQGQQTQMQQMVQMDQQTQQMGQMDPIGDIDDLQNDAMVIYDRFVSMQAETPLGCPDQLRLRVEENICGESGVKASCFTELMCASAKVLETRYLGRFMTSPLFKSYLTELMSTIQSPEKKVRRSGSVTSISTCSSENSINTRTRVPRSKSGHEVHAKILRNVDDRSMSMTNLDATSPDQLWQRRCNTITNIGEVDRLGRYTSFFESLPDAPSREQTTSKLSKAVKRIINGEVDSVQEELAWQMAEMIVKDVTDMTGKSSSERDADR